LRRIRITGWAPFPRCNSAGTMIDMWDAKGAAAELLQPTTPTAADEHREDTDQHVLWDAAAQMQAASAGAVLARPLLREVVRTFLAEQPAVEPAAAESMTAAMPITSEVGRCGTTDGGVGIAEAAAAQDGPPRSAEELLLVDAPKLVQAADGVACSSALT